MQSIVHGAVAATDTVARDADGPPPAAARLVLSAIEAVLLQLAVLATYLWGNDLLGYNLGLLSLPALPVVLLFSAGARKGRKSVRLSWKLLVAISATIAVLLLPVGVISDFDLWGGLRATELVLLSGAVSDLILAYIAIFARLSRPSQTVLLCWALLTAVSRVLHYNLSYHPGVVGLESGGQVDLKGNFLDVCYPGIGANVVLAVIPFLPRVAYRVTSKLRVLRRLVALMPHLFAMMAFIAAVLAMISGLMLDEYPSRPLFFLFPTLAVAASAAPRMERRFRCTLMWILALITSIGFLVDPGLTGVIFLVAVSLAAYSSATGIESDRSGPVSDLIPRLIPVLFAAGLTFGVPLLVTVIAGWAGEPPGGGSAWATVHRRIFALIHPGSGEFANHMYTAQMAMRGALEHGGIFGDGWWHNSIYFPQINSDFVLAVLFRHHGFAGWGFLGLLAVFLLALGRLPLTKKFDGDAVRAEALGGVALVTFLTVAVPVLWILGAFALQLPWTGIPFPFLSRGVYLHFVLTCLVGTVVFLDKQTQSARATDHSRPSPARALRWSFGCIAVVAGYFAIQFAYNVQLPVLRPADERPRYILVPENAGEVVRLVPGVESDASEYRVGNALMRLAVHDRTDRHLEEFAYISGYVFNKAEATRGIRIGKEGLFSPVVLGYVVKTNDAILFWESMDGELVLRPSSNGIKIIALPNTAVQGEELGREVRLNEVLQWDTTLRIGDTRLRLGRGTSEAEALRIELDPEHPYRAYRLRKMQGRDFRISRTRETVIGGLSLAKSAIEPGRSLIGWVNDDEQYVRGSLRDRSGRALVQPTETGAEFADPNLVTLIGTAGTLIGTARKSGRPFGLEHFFDPILSGVHKRGTLWDVTKRTLRKERLRGDDIRLTIDLTMQRKLTDAVNQFANNTDATSGSALILDGHNRVLSLADFDRSPDATLPSDPGVQGWVSVRFDSGFWDWFTASHDKRRYDGDLNRNPFLRRPLLGAFATELPGSVFKGFIYVTALEDHYTDRGRWFAEAQDPRDAQFLALPGDIVNTATRGGSRVLASETVLLPFDGNSFPEIYNNRRAAVPPVLGDAIARSSNIAPAYLALGLHGTRKLAPALSQFGLQQELLLRSEALDSLYPFLNDAAHVLAEAIRFADSFDWSNPSDVARLGGLGDKIYLSLLHVAFFYATILIHDGHFVHPTIVSSIGEDAIRPPRFPVLNPAAEDPTINAMKTLFRLPLEPGGTGASFARGLPPSIQVRGGKTGTASVPGDNDAPHRIFVAIVEIGGEVYTIATRFNRSRARDNEALELARRIVLDVLR